MQKVYEESTMEFITHLTMNKKKFKDAYDMGENIAVFSGEGICTIMSITIGLTKVTF